MNFEKIYTDLQTIRILEEEIAKRYSEQQMRCPVHLSIGQEGCAVGVNYYLKKSDIMFSSHRSHAHYIAKNCSLDKMLCEIYGKENGCVGGRGGSMHIQDIEQNFYASIPLVASALGPSVGVALNLKRKKSKNIVVVYIGDGAMEEGIVHEAFNFSSLYGLPILFVCENNLYSVYTHLSRRQISSDMTRFAGPHKIKSLKIDGNDVLKVIKESDKAIKYVRTNLKPFFLQLDTYRWREHCGPNYDNHIGYRSIREFELWKKKCPILKFENYLKNKKLLNEKKKQKIKDAILKKINKSFKLAINSNLPNPKSANKFLYN